MLKLIKRRAKRIATPPDPIIHAGEKKLHESIITLVVYSESKFEEKVLSSFEEYLPYKNTDSIKWLRVEGISDPRILEKAAEIFGIHPLIIEDIANTDQRPKTETFPEYNFTVLKLIHNVNAGSEINTEQVSIITGKDYVISFEETPSGIFNNVRERIRTSKGKIRKLKADFLAYALLDTIVDNYFITLEKISEDVEYVEEVILEKSEARGLDDIHKLKGNNLFLRKSIWPVRDLLSLLCREESPIFTDQTKIYLKDIHDHTVQIIDTLEILRDMSSNILELYLSSLSHRMNQVMKVLMIIATFFIPITFLAGLYGMNFRHMPLLEWEGGFFILLGIMFCIDLGMFYFFRKKKWF